MRRFAKLTRAVSTIGALSLVLGAAACGDDDDDGANPDARMFDATMNPDAEPTFDAMPSSVRSGTIAVVEAYVTNPEAAALCGSPGCISGSTISVSFSDGRTGTAPHPDWTNAVGSCLITVYDVGNGDVPATPTNEGVVSITGTSHGPVGCQYDDQLKQYLCANVGEGFSGDLPMLSTAAPAGNGLVVVSVAGADFSAIKDQMRGMWVNLNGFDHAVMNGNFPILAAGSDVPGNLGNGVFLTVNPALSMATSVTGSNGTYATAAGASPIPSTPSFDTFLDDGSTEILVSKGKFPDTCTEGEDCVTDPINQTLRANGAGFTLDDESDQPHALPTTGDVTFSCNGTNGICGPTTSISAGAGILNVLVVSGETTDADLTGVSDPFEMPPPVSQYATFQCSSVSVPAGVNIPAAALSVIMGTNPTRIFTQVFQVNGNIVSNGTTNPNTSTTNVLAGHGVAGYTTLSP